MGFYVIIDDTKLGEPDSICVFIDYIIFCVSRTRRTEIIDEYAETTKDN